MRLRTHDVSVEFGQAQATLLGFFQAFRPAEHGVDEHQFLGLRRISLQIDDEQPQGQVDLVRRQSHTAGFIHQFKHAVHGIAQLSVHAAHGLGLPSQAWDADRERFAGSRDRKDETWALFLLNKSERRNMWRVTGSHRNATLCARLGARAIRV